MWWWSRDCGTNFDLGRINDHDRGANYDIGSGNNRDTYDYHSDTHGHHGRTHHDCCPRFRISRYVSPRFGAAQGRLYPQSRFERDHRWHVERCAH